MVFQEVFRYDIKFDYDNAGDRKFHKLIAADNREEAVQGCNEIARKLFNNGVVTSQNLRSVQAIPLDDDDQERLTFGKVIIDIGNFIK